MKDKLQAVRAAIVKAVPEIMELKFGCEIIYKGLHYYYIRESLTAGHWCLRGFERTITGEEWFETFEPAFLEILGRPIRLADVLLAVHETNKDKTDAWGDRYCLEITDFGMFCGGISGNYYDWESEPIFWNLHQDDLSQQSPEFIEFLHSLLCV